MADYISREAAIEWFSAFAHMGEESIPTETILSDLKYAIPAADVEPVRHGVWEKRVERGRIFGVKERMVCSCCGSYNGTLMIRFNYCHNCGAKMDLEGDNGN